MKDSCLTAKKDKNKGNYLNDAGKDSYNQYNQKKEKVRREWFANFDFDCETGMITLGLPFGVLRTRPSVIIPVMTFKSFSASCIEL